MGLALQGGLGIQFSHVSLWNSHKSVSASYLALSPALFKDYTLLVFGVGRGVEALSGQPNFTVLVIFLPSEYQRDFYTSFLLDSNFLPFLPDPRNILYLLYVSSPSYGQKEP